MAPRTWVSPCRAFRSPAVFASPGSYSSQRSVHLGPAQAATLPKVSPTGVSPGTVSSQRSVLQGSVHVGRSDYQQYSPAQAATQANGQSIWGHSRLEKSNNAGRSDHQQYSSAQAATQAKGQSIWGQLRQLLSQR